MKKKLDLRKEFYNLTDIQFPKCKLCNMKNSTFIVFLLLGWVSTIYSNTINQGATLTIMDGTTLTNIGNFENQSDTIFNSGTIKIVNGTFENQAVIINNDTIILEDGLFTNSGVQTVGGL